MTAPTTEKDRQRQRDALAEFLTPEYVANEIVDERKSGKLKIAFKRRRKPGRCMLCQKPVAIEMMCVTVTGEASEIRDLFYRVFDVPCWDATAHHLPEDFVRVNR